METATRPSGTRRRLSATQERAQATRRRASATRPDESATLRRASATRSRASGHDDASQRHELASQKRDEPRQRQNDAVSDATTCVSDTTTRSCASLTSLVALLARRSRAAASERPVTPLNRAGPSGTRLETVRRRAIPPSTVPRPRGRREFGTTSSVRRVAELPSQVVLREDLGDLTQSGDDLIAEGAAGPPARALPPSRPRRSDRGPRFCLWRRSRCCHSRVLRPELFERRHLGPVSRLQQLDPRTALLLQAPQALLEFALGHVGELDHKEVGWRKEELYSFPIPLGDGPRPGSLRTGRQISDRTQTFAAQNLHWIRRGNRSLWLGSPILRVEIEPRPALTHSR